MDVQALATKLEVEQSIVERAVLANGFSIDLDYTTPQENLITMYTEYLLAKEDEKNARLAFKYQDGEESVDKSEIYDQYRKYANDLRRDWSEAKALYDDEFSGSHSFFTIRKRAPHLDARTRQ
ncbi:hypothetical protein LAU42_08870 [Macrococcus armenti]|uniref:hypothetical protein n=1 Tax=Macrococcus armenti TaxID=2875764 RepID=UPI001CCAD98A|nr:hypothetical protein [Macrococcus armenti]UBH21878.1 hypothetical protein LAU42_08870 [Macrococcus armenti]